MGVIRGRSWKKVGEKLKRGDGNRKLGEKGDNADVVAIVEAEVTADCPCSLASGSDALLPISLSLPFIVVHPELGLTKSGDVLSLLDIPIFSADSAG